MPVLNSITIHKESCIGCGLCVKDCPSSHISLQEGTAVAMPGHCLECGHCYAICPRNAVSMNGYDAPEENITEMTELDPDIMLRAMKSRRTVRQFRTDPVEQDKLDKILEAGRYSPTAANSQSLSFTVLGDRQDALESACVNLFRNGMKLAAPFLKRSGGIRINDSFFFKGAPLVIVVSANSGVDAGLASSYMELMAESLGLGVLYSGFFIACTRLSLKVKRLLCLPKGKKPRTCMVIGYPAVKYRRIPPRKALKVKELH